MLKLYIAVDSSLSSARQAVQGAHALANFAAEHPKEFVEWQSGNNTLIWVDAHPEWLVTKATDAKQVFTEFHETEWTSVADWVREDELEGEFDRLTAVAIYPDWIFQHVVLEPLKLATIRDGLFEEKAKKADARNAEAQKYFEEIVALREHISDLLGSRKAYRRARKGKADPIPTNLEAQRFPSGMKFTRGRNAY